MPSVKPMSTGYIIIRQMLRVIVALSMRCIAFVSFPLFSASETFFHFKSNGLAINIYTNGALIRGAQIYRFYIRNLWAFSRSSTIVNKNFYFLNTVIFTMSQILYTHFCSKIIIN